MSGHFNGWIGVDLDGTLARYDGWKGPEHIGDPIPLMVTRVKQWLAEGKDVRIFTARVYGLRGEGEAGHERRTEALASKLAIMKWCEEHIGQVLPITCTKDYGMVRLWDDRAIQVVPNTGLRVDSISRNYSADKETFPTHVQFADNRTVRIQHAKDGTAYLEISG